MLEALLFQRKGAGGLGGDIGTLPLAPSLVSKKGHVAAIVGDELFIGNGWDAGSVTTTAFQKCNLLTGVWTVLPDFPQANAYCYLTAVGTLLYFYGRTTQMHVFDTVAGTWSVHSNTPAEYNCYGGSTGYRDGKLYLAGGSGGGTATERYRFREYDIASKTWKQMPRLPTEPIYSMGGLIGDRYYVVGGGQSGITLDTNLRYYDFIQGAWYNGPATGIAAAWSGGRAVVYNGKLYITGGIANSAIVKTVVEFDPATNTVRQLVDMPTPRRDHAVAAGVGKLYLHCGLSDVVSTINNTFISYSLP
jgi:N-acetylneuraminic acid mutarotase